jgi:hypothetical protein
VTTGFAGVETVGQFGFFDADRRLLVITAKGDPLEMIAAIKPLPNSRKGGYPANALRRMMNHEETARRHHERAGIF